MDAFNLAHIWLLVGVSMLVVEALGIPGVGFLFAGLGAIATGAAIQTEFVATNAITEQWLIFFVSTIICAAALWKPMQKLRNRKQGNYRNMVGDTAYVGGSGLNRKHGGEVTWSGTIMKASLCKSTKVERLDAGTPVIITDVAGATLVVKPQE